MSCENPPASAVFTLASQAAFIVSAVLYMASSTKVTLPSGYIVRFAGLNANPALVILFLALKPVIVAINITAMNKTLFIFINIESTQKSNNF
jgi:hypothetical protein